MLTVVVVVVVVVMVMLVSVHAEHADVVCYPNGTAEIANPDATLYTSVKARNDVTMCTTSWETHEGVAKAIVTISGCAIDLPMDVVFSTRELGQTDDIIGGDDVYAYSFTCDEIPLAGVDRTFTQALTNKMSTMTEASISPTFTIKSALRNLSGVEVTSAIVGEALSWTIDVPSEYTALMTSCTAYAGTSTSSSIYILMIEDGCTKDADLVGSFSNANMIFLTHERRYFVSLWAFKFASSDDVLFHCDVKFCPPDSDSCDMVACTSRRRRAVTLENEAGVTYGSTSRVLRVTEVIPQRSTSGVRSGHAQSRHIVFTVLHALLPAAVCWMILK